MTDTAWKAFERRIAAVFGGTRRGAYTGNGRSGKSDIIIDGWSVECKLLSKPSFQDLLNAALQAERNMESERDIPVAIVKRKRDLDANALVVLRLETFRAWFIGAGEEVDDGVETSDPPPGVREKNAISRPGDGGHPGAQRLRAHEEPDPAVPLRVLRSLAHRSSAKKSAAKNQ